MFYLVFLFQNVALIRYPWCVEATAVQMFYSDSFFFIESYFCCSGATCMVALIAGVSSENCNSFGVAYIFVQRRSHYLEVISRVYSLCLAPTRLGQNWVLDPALSHCSVTTDHTLWMRPKRFQNLTCRTSGLLLMANATEWNWPLVRCVHSTKRGSLYSLIRAPL